MMNELLNSELQFETKRANNLAFQLGWVGATLTNSISAGVADGVTITDPVAFEKWAKNEIARAKSEADRLYPRG